jgi:TetR/AcrR family transcriptional regulator, transcriptional repressor for nem operon
MGRVSDAKKRLMAAVLELIWTGSYGHTTIDQICERAGVKKGSFYYFFHDKADLAVAAFEAQWRARRAELDAIFSPTVPPLRRLQQYCQMSYRSQLEIKRKYGRVLGCPLVALGSEICTQEDCLRKKIQEILEYKRRYLESAIRDAHAGGWLRAPDPAAKARMILAYDQGLLTQARIQNDVSGLRDTVGGIFAMLGVNPPPDGRRGMKYTFE